MTQTNNSTKGESSTEWADDVQWAQPAPQRRRRRHHKKKSVLPKVIGIVVAILAVIVIALGIMGIKLVSEAKQVQTHEQKALASIGSMNGSDISNITEISAKLPQIQNETKQAEAIAHGFVWNVYSKLPWIGDDITTVQGMTTTVNSLTSTSIPQFVDVIHDLQNANIDAGGDVLNVQPILALQPKLDNANSGLQKSVTSYNQLPGAHISMIAEAYNSGHTQLNELANTVNRLCNTFNMLPAFLGGNGKLQTYAIMAMTTSEIRSSGGLIGSVGELTTDNGKISIGDFHSNAQYLKVYPGRGALTEDEAKIFTDQGPMPMSFDIRDIAALPNTSSVAVAMRSIWEKTPWGATTPLDGVLLVDPVFLQTLIGINGDVTLPNGVVLTGQNTAEYLLNTVYKDYGNNNDVTDALFQAAAMQSIDSMFSNLNIEKLIKVGDALGQMAEERHFSMYSFNPELESKIEAAGFTASEPNSETHPAIGVYLNEQQGSKMAWYLDRSAIITRTSCNADGSQTYHVEYQMKNTMTPEEVANLPIYITGTAKGHEGWLIEKMLFFAPAGGSIAGLTGTGTASLGSVQQVSMDGAKPYMAIVTLKPGQTMDFSFDVTTSDKAKIQLSIDQTPMGKTNDPVRINALSCKSQN